jgi:hypothetical protein
LLGSWGERLAPRQSDASSGARFETITAHRLAIEKGSLIAGRISFQIRNIASLQVSEYKPNAGVVAGGFAILFSIGLCAVVGVPTENVAVTAGVALACLVIIVWIVRILHRFQLVITSAAIPYRLISRDENFLLKLKRALEEAMQDEGRSNNYEINIDDHRVEKVEANTTIHNLEANRTTVKNSKNVNIGRQTGVNQSANSITQGLKDVSTLISLIERSNNDYKDFYIHHLETVRQYLAGTKSKEEATASWGEFVQYAGVLAAAGINIWDFVTKIGSVFVK